MENLELLTSGCQSKCKILILVADHCLHFLATIVAMLELYTLRNLCIISKFPSSSAYMVCSSRRLVR